jgi:hypothetical protein
MKCRMPRVVRDSGVNAKTRDGFGCDRSFLGPVEDHRRPSMFQSQSSRDCSTCMLRTIFSGSTRPLYDLHVLHHSTRLLGWEHAFASEEAGMSMARACRNSPGTDVNIPGQVVRYTRHFSCCIRCAGVDSAAARKEGKVRAVVQQLKNISVYFDLAQ